MTTITRKMVDDRVVTEYEVHRFMTDASDLGLPPGEFPVEIPTELGNGQPFRYLSRHWEDPGIRIYRQDLGCITLMILND